MISIIPSSRNISDKLKKMEEEDIPKRFSFTCLSDTSLIQTTLEFSFLLFKRWGGSNKEGWETEGKNLGSIKRFGFLSLSH